MNVFPGLIWAMLGASLVVSWLVTYSLLKLDSDTSQGKDLALNVLSWTVLAVTGQGIRKSLISKGFNVIKNET